MTSPSASAPTPTPTPSSTMLPKMMEDKEEYEKEKNKNLSSSSATASETETEKKIGLMNYFKQLGMPFLAWWTGVWVVTGVGIYSGMELFGIDVLGMLQTTLPSNNYIDFSKVDPKTGNVMTAVAINELIEPIRFPFVLLTAKPIIKWWKEVKKKK
ncbi:hypothetical protein FRACYDRAFT_250908 [Fragilariopsis cylindrus CCMP1102]|uniref:DUF1279 domain-containing protein n=1 Tax=Fragilariopsis cylindrus CCMP1102 TaxID=635003 RepID=A0A1E7ENH4_9STRA|nr:hypothetical protein FRACYDRAFT_250908 [Fragilariopsis cylindrus CCMP1102]|eukprot:OEU07490.1 hypothetical protein FRACYDRAFT_250908 [Fragilariopsis cylindrus CCMP1102]